MLMVQLEMSKPNIVFMGGALTLANLIMIALFNEKHYKSEIQKLNENKT